MVCGRLPKESKHNDTFNTSTATSTNDTSFLNVDLEEENFELLNHDGEVEEQVHDQEQIEIQAEPIRSTTRRHKKHLKKSSTFLLAKPMHFNKTDGKKSKGNRVARRHENMLELIQFLGDDNLDLDRELTIDDLIVPRMSAFARIMLESTQLKLWSDFISRSGQEQDEIIEYAEKLLLCKRNKGKSQLKQFSQFMQENFKCQRKLSSSSSGKLRNSSSDDLIYDYCVIDDSYEDVINGHQNGRLKNTIGKFLFSRVDKNIRDVFKRSFSHEKLCELEELVLNTFLHSPDSIYISKLPDSFDRLILHGICQYFNLSSKSFDKNGCKHTQVENTHDVFKVPCVRLSEYVKLNFTA